MTRSLLDAGDARWALAVAWVIYLWSVLNCESGFVL
jgi:hypothetical protein